MKLIAALVFVLLAASAATFFVTKLDSKAGPQVSRKSPLDEAYDYYVQDMDATRFASDGSPVSVLRAERVTHFPEDDRAELVSPAYASFGANAWQVSAASGTLMRDAQRDEDRLELEGTVELRKPLAAGDFVEVSTSALTVFVQSEEAFNDVPVELRMRGSRLNGRSGMRARLTENYIHLNESNGTHDPATRP